VHRAADRHRPHPPAHLVERGRDRGLGRAVGVDQADVGRQPPPPRHVLRTHHVPAQDHQPLPPQPSPSPLHLLPQRVPVRRPQLLHLHPPPPPPPRRPPPAPHLRP